ncbi:MAG: hypothetical protein ACK515_28250 [bacterium]
MFRGIQAGRFVTDTDSVSQRTRARCGGQEGCAMPGIPAVRAITEGKDMGSKASAFTAVLVSTLAASAVAADYPASLRGRYAYSGGDCKSPALVIEQSRRFNDVDATCTLRATPGTSAARFVAEERCNREGREWTQKTVFELDKGTLKLTEGRDQAQYRACNPVAAGAAAAATPATVTAAAAAAAGTAPARAVNCKVSPGQAGVTTFLDGALTRPGNAIRDFDGYTFRVTGRIQVKKAEVLVGQLVRADGSISEPKSWAMADEWDCR